MEVSMTITPSDLAVGQVYRDNDRDAWNVDWLDLPTGRAAWTVVYADGLSDGVNAGAARTLAGFLNRNGAKLETPAPAPIPHPSALGDLYEACVAEVKWYDETLDNYHPDDHALRALVRKTHGTRIDAIRAAIRKAGGVA